MTVSSTVNKTQANGNGSTSAFPFAFKFTASSEIEVYVDDTLKTLSTHYTLSSPGDSGTVTFLTAPTDFRPQTGEVVTIRRIQPLTQTFDPTAGGGLSSSSVEGSDDNLLMKIQQIDEQSDRAPRLKTTTETGQLTFPEPVASAIIAYNAGGTDLETKALADIDDEVTLPVSSTDNAIVRWDGATGKSFQNSGVTIDDSDNIVTPGNVTANILGVLSHIELGGALDTTLTRVSAGVVAIEGVNILTAATGQPLDADLTAIAAVATTAYGRALLALADDAALQAYIGVREVLATNRTYYVRTDGSDSNTGLVDSAGGAFLTLQHAYDVIASTIDCAGFNITISLGAGTHTSGLDAITPITGQGILAIVGDVATPANVILSVTNAHGILNRTGCTVIHVSGIEFRTTTAGNCIWAYENSKIAVVDAIRMGASAGDHFIATEGGEINIATDYTISGGAINHWHAYGWGEIICQNRTITLSGTPAWSGGGSFLGIAQGAAYVDGNTFSGSATGSRFLIHKNGYVDTGTGGSATYFPGNSAGTLLGGGLMDNIEGTIASNSSILSSGATGGIGYSTGAGDAVTQATSKTTTVATNNKMCGQITMNNAALGAGASVVFQSNNSNVDANDVVIVTVSNGVTGNAYTASVVHTGAGTFNTRVTNTTAGSLSDAVVLNFAIIKCVTS